MNVLAMGACGYKGTLLIPKLLIAGQVVTALDTLRFGNLTNAAAYLVDPKAQTLPAALPDTQTDISTQVIPSFKKRIYTHRIDGYHRDIGNLTSLEQAHKKNDAIRHSNAVRWRGTKGVM